MRTNLTIPPFIKRIGIAFRALFELGFEPLTCLTIYRLGLATGHYRRVTPSIKTWQDYFFPNQSAIQCNPPFIIPTRHQLAAVLGNQATFLLQEAEELLTGKIHLFGAEAVDFSFNLQRSLAHWTEYEQGKARCEAEDIKTVWEPGRFGWTFLLGRAYLLTGDERYPQHFWKLTREFLDTNPPNLGLQWTSAQEVALRLFAFLFAMRVFSHSTINTPENNHLMTAAVIAHAERITPTLWYSRAQNNNHLLTEALGLYAAGISISVHPRAQSWRETGWYWFNRGLQNQIAPDGTYAQHSTNYHRLMLQTALWAQAIANQKGLSLPRHNMDRLGMATRWLCAHLDPISGQVPNLGHNDGAYIFPLASGGFSDYRPVAQAAGRAFMGQCCLPSGAWNEMCLWLGLETNDCTPDSQFAISSPAVHRLGDAYSWATLRAARFDSRPAHADQLHVDLWWQGENIARNAGTFSYNISAPWDNALAHTHAHNTITIDNRDQMLRAGKFLWLNWAQARLLESTPHRLVAEHDGYRSLGLTHRRSLDRLDRDHWVVTDTILSTRKKNQGHIATLHWLLPDWEWQLDGTTLQLKGPAGKINLQVAVVQDETLHLPKLIKVELIRGGQNLLCDECDTPFLGWVSPTYGVKIPALSFRTHWQAVPAFSIQSKWILSSQTPF